MKTWVLYHAQCFDGMGAAWAAWRKLGDEEVEYVPVRYGEPPPAAIAVDDQALIVDFSYPRDALLGLVERCLHVTVLDHHATARDDLAGLAHRKLTIEFDMNRSGAGIAWDHLHDTPRPYLIDYLEDRDLWRFNLAGSHEISAVIASYPFTLAAYQHLWNVLEHPGRLADVTGEGRALLRLASQQVAAMCDQAVTTRFGRPNSGAVPIVNAAILFGEVGEELLRRHPDAPFAAYYFDRADGRRQWGLRSRRGFDCTVIARLYGGGGHPTAAGFTSAIGWLP